MIIILTSASLAI